MKLNELVIQNWGKTQNNINQNKLANEFKHNLLKLIHVNHNIWKQMHRDDH